MNNLLPLIREPSLVDKAWMALRYPVDLIYHPMDALVSLPALSFLVIPAFSSYGTTINFLFFYMTWAVLIKSNPPLQVELLGTLAIRIIFYLLPSLAFLLFDSAAPSVAVNIKEHGDRALPMGEAQGGRKGRWWKITLVSIFNLLLGIALQVGTELLFTKVLRVRSALKLSTTLPMPWSIAKDLFFSLVLHEVLTYVFHRYALHSPQSRLTRLHESWQHSVLAPFALVAHYDHPIAYLAHVFLPMYIPAVLFRLHLLTYQLYLIIVSVEEAFAYSGYNILPSGFILGGIARRQERHLMGGGDGNFGCFGLADYALGTSVGSDLVDDVVDEADEKHVGTKTKKKATSIKRKAQRKKQPSSDEEEGSDREGQDEEEAEEVDEPREKPTRGGRIGRKSRDEDEEEEPEEPKRKARSSGRNGKKSNDDADDATAGADHENQKPSRKPSNAGKKTKNASGKTKKRSKDEE